MSSPEKTIGDSHGLKDAIELAFFGIPFCDYAEEDFPFEITAKKRIIIKRYQMRQKSGYDETQNRYVIISQHLIDYIVCSSVDREIQTCEFFKVEVDQDYQSSQSLVIENKDNTRQTIKATLGALTTLEP